MKIKLMRIAIVAIFSTIGAYGCSEPAPYKTEDSSSDKEHGGCGCESSESSVPIKGNQEKNLNKI